MKKLLLCTTIAVAMCFASCEKKDESGNNGSVNTSYLYYTSSDGKIVVPNDSRAFNAKIISNKYENGKGAIVFDDTITSIGDFAFMSCTSLTDITIPYSVTSIGFSAFVSTSLRSIIISDNITSIGQSAFANCRLLSSVTIGNSVTSIGDYAFEDCNLLTSVIIGNNVTSIGSYAFNGCTSLRSVTIPNSVTSIGQSAFEGCSSLSNITIGNSVTSIGCGAFSDCTSLRSIIIPNSVNWIENFAFTGCSRLTSVYCKPTIPPTGRSYMFNSNASGRKIYVPRNSVSAYKSASGWSNYASSIEGYDF